MMKSNRRSQRSMNINRITVEFKFCWAVKCIEMNTHINRITVEFKFWPWSNCPITAHILIESQWNLNTFPWCDIHPHMFHINRITEELKWDISSSMLLNALILIESQWNLNCCNILHLKCYNLILIESQWNLNNSFTAFSCSGAIDINRITVEFKYSDIAVLLTNISILIESQWNLNYICLYFFFACRLILIESQWNLNFNDAGDIVARVSTY